MVVVHVGLGKLLVPLSAQHPWPEPGTMKPSAGPSQTVEARTFDHSSEWICFLQVDMVCPKKSFGSNFCTSTRASMPKLSFAVAEDEATLLTVMTRGLSTDIEVPKGKDLGYAKNRAIDKLWQNIPFCHAVAALPGLEGPDLAPNRLSSMVSMISMAFWVCIVCVVYTASIVFWRRCGFYGFYPCVRGFCDFHVIMISINL